MSDKRCIDDNFLSWLKYEIHLAGLDGFSERKQAFEDVMDDYKLYYDRVISPMLNYGVVVPDWATSFAFTSDGNFMAFEITPYIDGDSWAVNYGRSVVVFSTGVAIDGWRDTVMHRFMR